MSGKQGTPRDKEKSSLPKAYSAQAAAVGSDVRAVRSVKATTQTNPRGKEEIQFEVSLDAEDDNEVLGPRSGSSSSAGGVAVGSDAPNVAAGSSAQVAVSPHQKPLVPAQRRLNPHTLVDNIRMPPPKLPQKVPKKALFVTEDHTGAGAPIIWLSLIHI